MVDFEARSFFREHFTVPYFALQLSGIWPSSSVKPFGIFIWLLVGLLDLVSIIASGIELYYGRTILFADAFAPASVTIAVFCKMGLLLQKNLQFDEVVRKVHAFYLSNLKYQELFGSKAKVLKKANSIYFGMSISTASLYIVMPLIVLGLLYFNGLPLIFLLPVKSWWPWDISSVWGFLPTYLLTATMVSRVPPLLVGIDSLILDVSTYAGVMFEVISRDILEVSDLIENQTSEAHIGEHLNETIRKHEKAISLCATWEDCVVEIAFIQFTSAALQICLGGFLILASDDIAIQINYFCFTSAVITQAYFYCWGGEAIIESSTNVAVSCYEIPWFDLDMKNKKKVLMMMLRAQKPVEIRIPFFNVSKPTFIAILQASHTYVTVLQTSLSQ